MVWMKFLIQKLVTERGKTRFYLRIEKDGVFQGWAVPKGLPDQSSKQHLALKVGPYPLTAEEFEGRMGEGKFPPGIITIWDRGSCRSRYESNEKIIVDLSGSRAKGTYALIRFKKAGPDGWLLSRPRESTLNKYSGKSLQKRNTKARLTRLSRSGTRFVLEAEKKDHSDFSNRAKPKKPKKRYFIFDAPGYKLLPWVYFLIFVFIVLLFLKLFVAIE